MYKTVLILRTQLALSVKRGAMNTYFPSSSLAGCTFYSHLY